MYERFLYPVTYLSNNMNGAGTSLCVCPLHQIITIITISNLFVSYIQETVVGKVVDASSSSVCAHVLFEPPSVSRNSYTVNTRARHIPFFLTVRDVIQVVLQ